MFRLTMLALSYDSRHPGEKKLSSKSLQGERSFNWGGRALRSLVKGIGCIPLGLFGCLSSLELVKVKVMAGSGPEFHLYGLLSSSPGSSYHPFEELPIPKLHASVADANHRSSIPEQRMNK